MGRCDNPIAYRHGRLMKLTPSQRVYCLGAILFVSLFVCSLNFGRTGSPSFLVPLAVAGIAYLLAIREFLSSSRLPQQVVIVGLVLAALCHLQFLRMPPGPDDDVHRYVWDGRVQRLGYNPYILIPNDPAWAGLHTSETRTMNNPHLPSPISCRVPAVLPRRNRHSRIGIRPESSIRAMRSGNGICLVRCARSDGA